MVSEVRREWLEFDTEISRATAYWHIFIEYYAHFFYTFHSLRHKFIQM